MGGCPEVVALEAVAAAPPWRIAETILQLLAEVNAAAPNRSKVSDGTIGDAAHATRSSDHNPWVKDRNGVGVVTAVDITHDPTGGMDCHDLAGHFVERARAGDRRVKYVIWNQRIYNRSIADRWRSYTGSNPHTRHLHLSVASDQARYDDVSAWGIAATEDDDMIREGARGPAALALQMACNDYRHYAGLDREREGKPAFDVKALAEDGIAGPATFGAARALLRDIGIRVDAGEPIPAECTSLLSRWSTRAQQRVHSWKDDAHGAKP